MILLFLGAEFTAHAKSVRAAHQSRSPGPSVGPFLRHQSEVFTVFEMCDGVAQRSADDLASSALQLHAEPAIFAIKAAHVVGGCQCTVGCQLVTGTSAHGQVECVTAPSFGIAVFLQAVIID